MIQAASTPKSKIEILQAVSRGELSADDAARMFTDKPAQKLYAKVSEKGAVSVYGLQRMPVTLYAGQWERLVEFVPQISEFIKANDKLLSRKS
jgi:hypothetical protein